jgi:hypothetical protein
MLNKIKKKIALGSQRGGLSTEVVVQGVESNEGHIEGTGLEVWTPDEPNAVSTVEYV